MLLSHHSVQMQPAGVWLRGLWRGWIERNVRRRWSNLYGLNFHRQNVDRHYVQIGKDQGESGDVRGD